MSASEPASLLGVENTLRTLLNDIREARRRENAQAQRITKLEHENHALHLALQKLKEKRSHDRGVIEMWRQYASGDHLATDASTQEHLPVASAPVNLPSSPPIDRAEDSRAVYLGTQSSQISQSQQPTGPRTYELSQRLLPMSIDVEELYDDRKKVEAAWDEERVTSSQSSSTSAINESPNLPKRSLSEKSESQSNVKRPRVAEKSESFPLSSQRNSEKCREELSPTIADLMHRKWHPSDFILNPNPQGYKRVDFAFTEVVRNKSQRQCMHGRDCTACSKFFELAGHQEAIAKSSRHRADFSHQETPAGFWRTEFPESADVVEDQREAEAQWTAEGQNRLLEAIKQGKYLFKDKKLRAMVQANSLWLER